MAKKQETTAAQYHGQRPIRFRPTEDAVQGQQIEQAGQDLGSLNNVGDCIGLQGMDRPDQRRDQRQRSCRAANCKRRQPQAPPHDAEQRQPAQNVNRQIEDVVTQDTRSAQGVVDRQRQIGHGATIRGAAFVIRR